MSDDQPPEILGGLPKKRPQRRSDKRAGAQGHNASSTKRSSSTRRGRARTETLRQPRQPRGTPPKPESRRPAPPSGTEIVSTVAQAVVELAEIGLSAGARTIRDVLSRLPRP